MSLPKMSVLIFIFISLLFSPSLTANITAATFCNVIQNNLCIRNQPINNTGFITSPNNKNILINNTYLICTNISRCTITIITNFSITINNSVIQAPFINISSPTSFILNNSEISTNGTMGPKDITSPLDQGIGFLGLGAFCGALNAETNNNTYGKFCENLTGTDPNKYSGTGGLKSNTYGIFYFKFK